MALWGVVGVEKLQAIFSDDAVAVVDVAIMKKGIRDWYKKMRH